MTVKVTVSENSIVSIDYSDNLETVGVGSVALDQLSKEILQRQSVGVDTITGASFSSRALLAGVKDCLKQAGGNLERLSSPARAADAEKSLYSADVVVIGGGGSGLAAAISAAQNGASVIVVEKLGILGGSTNVSEGALNAVDPKRQGALGIEDSVEKFYTQTMTGGHNKGTPALVDYLTKHAYESLEWLESLGVKFKDQVGTATGALWQRSHYTVTPSGNSYIRVFAEYIKHSDKIQVLLETPAQAIRLDKSGRAVAVVCSHKGRQVTVKAGKGVIIATGGFGANVAMRQEMNTGVWKSVKLDSSIGCTNIYACAQGDGIVMAQKIGAQVTGMSDIQIHPCGTPGTGLMTDIRTSGRNRLFVNKHGDRFVNEGAARDMLAQAIFDQEGSTYWIVVNKVRYPSRDWVDENGATIANMVALGSVVEAGTLDELAGKCGMDAAKLKASVEAYNAIVRGESKDSFGFLADNKADVQLTEGPWYACRKVPTVHHTMGGLKINASTEVLGEADRPIPGLFACGEVTGGIHGSNRLGGNAIADCMVFGRLAGKNAADGD
jgi:flavocytochrome c